MKTYRVMVVKYGYADIETESEAEALELVGDMSDKDFDWTDFGDGEIVEEYEE